MPKAKDIFTPKKAPPAKKTKAVRLTIEACELLDELIEVYESNAGHCIEALIKTYAPPAIREAKQSHGTG